MPALLISEAQCERVLNNTLIRLELGRKLICNLGKDSLTFILNQQYSTMLATC